MGKHYVPIAYLKGFCHPETPGLLWQYDKKEDRFTHASVKKIAQEKDYYSGEIEDQLQRFVDGPGDRVLKKIQQGKDLEEDDCVMLSIYIGTMFYRGPRRRRKPPVSG